VLTYRRSPLFGFGLMVTGQRFPHTRGLFGGYGTPVLPLMKASGVDALEAMAAEPTLDAYDVVEVMNAQPFEGASYSTHHGGHSFEPSAPGALWMHAQGGGGGYGDVLDREPAAVLQDLEDRVISEWTAEHVYGIVWNRTTGVVDAEATQALRDEVRAERLAQSTPFDAFEAAWRTDEPAAELAFFGCWNDAGSVYAGGGPGTAVPSDQLAATMMLPPAP
jgi:hypothetical protein